MFLNRERGFTLLCAAAQCLLVSLISFTCASASGLTCGTLQEAAVELWLPWSLGICFEALWVRSVSLGDLTLSWRDSARRAVVSSLLALALCGVLFYQGGYSSGPALWQLFVGGASLVVTYRFLPQFLAPMVFYGVHNQRAVIVGEPGNVAALCKFNGGAAVCGQRRVGWLAAGVCPSFDPGIPFLGEASAIESIVRDEDVDHVILADVLSAQQVARWKADCERWGVRLVVAQSLALHHPGHFLWETRGFWCFGPAYREPLQCPLHRVLKRSLDLAVAIPATLLVLAPVALITWVSHRLQSPGPLFFRQDRHGRRNAVFRVWKFRTMHDGAACLAQAQKGDSRIFPFGSWLRRHSLDELPQFLNVLRGEMSVVGPRPHYVKHTEIFGAAARYHVRSFVKPGVTGLAQVNGFRGEVRSAEDLIKRVEFDVRYVQEWSLHLDIKLICRTISIVLNPPSTAY